MDASLRDQILNLIEKSNSILLLTHAKADCDGLGSMISMYLTLQSMGKEVVAATNDPTPDNLGFLPSISMVQNSITSKNFIITLDISNTPLNKIKYKLADDQKSVNIVVTPSEGRFKPSDVKFGGEEGSFDLIMTFDTGNLEHLGPIYDQNAELFFKVPVINVDHHASNTDYGKVNLVDVVAASTTEVMLVLLEEMEKKYEKRFVTPDIATLLLAGLITDTGSFQHANTSPRAMETAAKLLDKGARQQEIIKNIYKTKKLSTLKLWGLVLSKVESDPVYRMVWSSISKQDLAETKASADESETIIDDLLSNAPGAEVIMLFKYNDDGYVSVSMRSTTNSVDVGKICQELGGGGHIRAAGFKRRDSSNLEQLIQDTLLKVRQYQGQRLNIHPETVREISEKMSQAEKQKTTPAKAAEAQPKTAESENKENKVQYLDFKDERKANETKSPAPKPDPQAVLEDKKPEASVKKPVEKPKEEKSVEKPKEEKIAEKPKEEKVKTTEVIKEHEESKQTVPVIAPEIPSNSEIPSMPSAQAEVIKNDLSSTKIANEVQQSDANKS